MSEGKPSVPPSLQADGPSEDEYAAPEPNRWGVGPKEPERSPVPAFLGGIGCSAVVAIVVMVIVFLVGFVRAMLGDGFLPIVK